GTEDNASSSDSLVRKVGASRCGSTRRATSLFLAFVLVSMRFSRERGGQVWQMWNKTWQEYRSPLRRDEAWYGFLFAGPWIIGFLAFVAGPFIASFVLSFSNYKVGIGTEWIGLGNYREMFAG